MLPEVGSTIVPPGRSSPRRSASSIIRMPIRSLTEPPGFSSSSLASTVGASPRVTWCSRTSGVFPIASRNVSRTCIAGPLGPVSPPHRATGGGQRAGLPASGPGMTVSCRCGAAGVAGQERSTVTDGEQRQDPASEKLLVVDDDPFIARLLEIELAAAGYQVRVANDGQQAIDLVGRGPAGPRHHRRDDAPRRRVRADALAAPGPAHRDDLRDHPDRPRPVGRQARGLRDRRGRLHRQAVRHARTARARPGRAPAQARDEGRVAADRPARQQPRPGGDREEGRLGRRTSRCCWSTSTASRRSTTTTGSRAATR